MTLLTAPKLPMTTSFTFPFSLHTYSKPNRILLKFFALPKRRHRLRLVGCARASVSRTGQGTFDPELRSVLELATDAELFELENILFGPSYFSPLLKSITNGTAVDYSTVDPDLQERENFIAALESRFLFLAADARSTLRGWRPSYRNVLLAVRNELNIPCSNKLSTGDLEVEIFLHLLQEYPSEELEASSGATNAEGGLELGFNGCKFPAQSAIKEFRSVILKGGGIVTFAKIYQLLARRLSGKVLLEAANYQIKREFIRKGGQLAAINLESRAALLAAKQVMINEVQKSFESMEFVRECMEHSRSIFLKHNLFVELTCKLKGLIGAASRYLGFRSMMTLLGPMLWGTFLADVVIQMLGTDYARILRAIYALAQIRITRTYKLPSVSSFDDKL